MNLLKALVPYGFFILHKKWRQKYGSASYMGLLQLDKKLISIINPRQNGFYVELGANDGLRQSNTYHLQYKYEWSGILIEPNPRLYRECILNRSFKIKPHFVCAACVPNTYSDRYIEMTECDLMSTSHNLRLSDTEVNDHINTGKKYLSDNEIPFRYAAIASTLTDILHKLNAPQEFDLLSLDVEGNELSVLEGLDFTHYSPVWILVEIRNTDNDVDAFLSKHGYIRQAIFNLKPDCQDSLYKKMDS